MNLGKRLFSKWFGFETGIDITDEVAVLYRRNIVIKNIVLISNLLYSLVFFILGFSVANPTTDWLFAIISLPITWSVGKTQSKLINLDKNDLTKQQIAMYVSSFWIFISAILVYVRIYAVGRNELFETAAYVLIFYSLVQISLYQDKKLLSNSFVSLLGFVTLIHFAVTYDFFHKSLTWQQFAQELTGDSDLAKQSAALILRTVIFVLFYLVNYIIVSIGQTIQEERKIELSKRREVQNDFTHIVKDLFGVVFQSASSLLDDRHAYKVSSMSTKLANFYNLDKDMIQNVNTYSLIHLQFNDIKDLMVQSDKYSESNYEQLKIKTDLGSKIAKRIQLAQKTSEVLRRTIENSVNENFITEMNKIQPDIMGQIIFASDCYISIRTAGSYHRPFNHKQAVDLLKNELQVFIDYTVREVFVRYEAELNDLYQKLA